MSFVHRVVIACVIGAVLVSGSSALDDAAGPPSVLDRDFWQDGCDTCVGPVDPAYADEIKLAYRIDGDDLEIKIKTSVPIRFLQADSSVDVSLAATTAVARHVLTLKASPSDDVKATLVAADNSSQLNNKELAQSGKYQSSSPLKPNFFVHRVAGETTHLTILWRGITVPLAIRSVSVDAQDVNFCVEPQDLTYGHAVEIRYATDESDPERPKLRLAIRSANEAISLIHPSLPFPVEIAASNQSQVTLHLDDWEDEGSVFASLEFSNVTIDWEFKTEPVTTTLAKPRVQVRHAGGHRAFLDVTWKGETLTLEMLGKGQ